MEATSGDLLSCSKCGRWFAFAVNGAKNPAAPTGASLGDHFEVLDLDALDQADAVSGPNKHPATSAKPAAKTPAPNKPVVKTQAPPANKSAPNTAEQTGAPAERSGAPAERSGAPAERSGAPAGQTGAPAGRTGPARSQASAEARDAEPTQAVNVPQPPAFVLPPSHTVDESAPSPLYRQMDVDQLDFSDPLEAIAEDALKPLEGIEAVPLEILDDPELFRDMEVDSPSTDSDRPTDEHQGDEDESSRDKRPSFSMISVRCRVCDTLQYIENKPGSKVVCEICFAVIQLADALEQANTKRGRWTAPSRMENNKNTSPESIGKLVESSRDEDDEVSELIRDVDARRESPVDDSHHSNRPAGQSDGGSKDENIDEVPDSDDELSLAPLDDDPNADRLSTIILEAETKALLESLHTPVQQSRSAPPAGTPKSPAKPSGNTAKPTQSEESNIEDLAVEEIADGDLVEDLLDEPLTAEGGEEQDRLPTDSRGRVSEEDGSGQASTQPSEELESLEAVELYGLEEVDLTLEPNFTSGATKVPPPFVVPPTASPSVSSTASPTASSAASPAGDAHSAASTAAKTPEGRRFTRVEKNETEKSKVNVSPLGALSVQYNGWVQDLLATLRSIPLVLAGVGILFVAYWLSYSWAVALSEGPLLLRLLGFVSGIVGALVGVPLWLAYLGVVANRSLSLGQAGRLTPAAITSQGLQFAIVLAGALPGAALGGFSLTAAATLYMATLTMLPVVLYFLTSAIVA